MATRPKEAGDVPPEHYLPGCVATLAMLMMQAVRREAIMSACGLFFLLLLRLLRRRTLTTHNTQYDTTGRGGFDTDPSDSFRARVWLFVSYLVSFSALVGSVWMLVADYADKPYPWPGIAGVLQCAFILAAGLFMWATRGGGMNGDSGMYW